MLYIDAIVADRYGAAYRLLCDIVAARRAKHPERRLVVVLMAVVSSDVLVYEMHSSSPRATPKSARSAKSGAAPLAAAPSSGWAESKTTFGMQL